MNKKVINFALIILIVLAISGFGVYAYRQQHLLRKIEVEYDGAKIVSLGWSNTVVDLYLRFTNPSDIDINVTGYRFRIFVNNKPISDVISTDKGLIQPNGESTIAMRFSFSPVQVIKNVMSKDVLSSLLVDYSEINIRVAGKIDINHRGIDIRDIDVNISDNLQSLIYGKSA